MKLVILGGPGAGKGTQATLLCQQLGITTISTGDILRQAIADPQTSDQAALAKRAKPYLDHGELVPDPSMIEFIRWRLQQGDVDQGWLLDGYPRTAFQAEELDFLLDDLTQQLDWAIWLEVSEPVLIDRCLGRSRSDDQLDVVQRRIQVLYESTLPMLDYYDYRQRLLRIDGEQPIEQVADDILRQLTRI